MGQEEVTPLTRKHFQVNVKMQYIKFVLNFNAVPKDK
jgi:hypothetical protein